MYSNLSRRHKVKKDKSDRKHAQYLASLPKNPFKRLLFHLHPKNAIKYWFSRRGLIMGLRIFGVTTLLVILFIGGLFAYFRKDLDAIRPSELSKRVQSTVTVYLDRNDNVLWEDKGDGDYKLVVDGDEISQYLKQATVAIEDKDFYNHGGVSPTGLIRAVINNLSGGYTQGGSTLTQQLVKQVFFSDESSKRGLDGIPRKIKEMILSIEVERMYSKDQILNLYLNESPYGGRRNGVESGAQTYFGKASKDLTIAEASLLAAIPQNPSVYDPYNILGHEGLIARQHIVINNMVEQGYITQEQATEAMEYPILDHITPEASQYTDIKAAHFVQMARAELIEELGATVVGKGGLTVKTTLDVNIQAKLEEAMDDMFDSSVPESAGFSNGAATVEDTETGQIVALLGSRDFNYPGYGQDNAAIAYIQPGSTIKSLVYAELFEKKDTGSINFGSGSILKDENIDELYGATLYNADHKFNGDITIRSALATSRNVPAVKAMYLSGVENTLDTIHALGGTSYCTQGSEVEVGLAASIGGCGIKQIDLVNAYASIARTGIYKEQSTILEVKNNADEVLLQWTDKAGTRIIDEQSAYIVSDILNDNNARAPLTGYYAKGMNISGVKTSTKTGTSDKDGNAKDIWMVSYSPALTMAVWLGNSDATTLKQGSSLMPGPIIETVMTYAHTDVYASEGKWKTGDWYTKPTGIQQVGTEIYPSWWSKSQGQTKEMMIFDKVSKKKATDLTPPLAQIELEVTKMVDPITKKTVYTAPEGYDASEDDDYHASTDVAPSVTVGVTNSGVDDNIHSINVVATNGTSAITSIEIRVSGILITTLTESGSFEYTVQEDDAQKSISVTAVDEGFYQSDTATAWMPAYQL